MEMMDTMVSDVVIPVALCIGAIAVAAIVYSIVSARKARKERQREQEILRERERGHRR
ncbi:hypothetical protein QUW40_01725 [Collinsella tanakaei]|uniref:hypothetical protein n=1 Tax=Collinsella tanakaei TaxID=626935 RepID=UPI0025A48289|nr:hypothetical protein [Collinsella tanakaei]MDM8245322.1 hypothetical protein [Collinsella tanakaei]